MKVNFIVEISQANTIVNLQKYLNPNTPFVALPPLRLSTERNALFTWLLTPSLTFATAPNNQVANLLAKLNYKSAEHFTACT